MIRNFGIFHVSAETDSSAGLAALGLSGPASGVLALTAESDKDRIPELQAAARNLGLELIGAVFPALLKDDRESGGIWLIGFPDMPPHVVIDAADPEQTAAAIEVLIPANMPGDPVLLTVFDACLPNLHQVLTVIGARLQDRVQFAGANAGSETFQPIACLFDRDRTFGGGVLAMVLPENCDPVLEHGYTTPVRMFMAGETQGCTVLKLDDRPAFEVYREALDEDYGLTVTEESFYEHSVHYPFGIMCPSGPVQIRIPVALNPDGGMTCVGEMPQGVVMVIMKAPQLDETDCVDRIAAAQNAAPQNLLTFYCAGRRMHLGGDQAASEMKKLHERTGAGAVLGALSLGEIVSDSRGAPAFHNAALTCLNL